ncbi:MAG: hypothetical protein LBG45_05490, partial [Dysgonamonadaceae bacterium]|nr:hypothetical protein [Dysgonamonadaceae bacterium]
MNKLIFLVLFFLAPLVLFSQISENFSDGLFYGDNRLIEWTGDVDKFNVNNSFQLQLDASDADSTAQLKTSSAFLRNMQWEWWMKMDFSPTADDYVKIFLCSDENNLTGELNGLFVRIGYTEKNVCLIRSEGENSETLIEGTEKRLDTTAVALRLKAVLDSSGNFNLYSKLDDETGYILEGSCSISESFESTVFGIACYFSPTHGKEFYFDDFLVRELESDNPYPEPNPDPDPDPDPNSDPNPDSNLSENFNDSLFHGGSRPVEWTGDIDKFNVNASLQLQLDASGADSPAQLRTSSAFLRNKQWEWWMKMDFSPTVKNYVKVFLCS